jgi:hypothetical protein
MASLPFADGELGGWISLNSIYFIPDLEGSFAGLARVTAAPGRGVLGGADPDWLSRQPFAEHGFAVRPIDDVVAALKGAGLATFVKSVQNPKSGVGYNFLACVPTADQSRGTH